jgi:hypothetical protein
MEPAIKKAADLKLTGGSGTGLKPCPLSITNRKLPLSRFCQYRKASWYRQKAGFFVLRLRGGPLVEEKFFDSVDYRRRLLNFNKNSSLD